MKDQDSKVQTFHPPEEVQAWESSSAQTTGAPVAPTRTIRYVDDKTFNRCLDEVVAAHDRLLAKLAE